MIAGTRDIFRRLLVPLWLRPERALWDAHELEAVGRMLGDNFVRPALECGCTEGVNTFVMLGGAFSIDTDDYEDLIHPASSSNVVQTTGDSFAAYRDDVVAAIETPAAAHFDVGVSWRDAHVVKAARLGLYDELHRVDLGGSLTALAGRSFATIWSPNLFWLPCERLHEQLTEQARLLAPGGRLLTILPDIRQAEAELWHHVPFMGAGWLDVIGREVGANLTKNARDDVSWRRLFAAANLTVTGHERFLPDLAGVVYQIGFRPMFPVFLEMYRRVKKTSVDDWRDLKRHWIETVYHFMAPLCDVGPAIGAAGEPLWHLYELRHAG